ncbi:MAG: twin-arginine translocation signal domain-containing protein [bacterium]
MTEATSKLNRRDFLKVGGIAGAIGVLAYGKTKLDAFLDLGTPSRFVPESELLVGIESPLLSCRKELILNNFNLSRDINMLIFSLSSILR